MEVEVEADDEQSSVQGVLTSDDDDDSSSNSSDLLGPENETEKSGPSLNSEESL